MSHGLGRFYALLPIFFINYDDSGINIAWNIQLQPWFIRKKTVRRKLCHFTQQELAPILLDMALFYQFYRFPQDIALPVLPQRKKSFTPCLLEAIRTELHDMFKMHEIILHYLCWGKLF